MTLNPNYKPARDPVERAGKLMEILLQIIEKDAPYAIGTEGGALIRGEIERIKEDLRA